MAESKRARFGRDRDAARVPAGEDATGRESPRGREPVGPAKLPHDFQKRLLEYRRRLRALALELSSAEERERHRVAAALHDQVSQDLAAARLRVRLLRESAPSEDRAASLAEVEGLLTRATRGAGSLTFELCPPVLHEEGLEAALRWLVEWFSQKRPVRFDFAGDGRSAVADSDLRAFLFQAVRELLTNVARHARASRAHVAARTIRGEVTITVEDDGVGFDPARLARRSEQARAFGLFSIRRRLQYLGGRLEIQAQPGRGARLAVILPV